MAAAGCIRDSPEPDVSVRENLRCGVDVQHRAHVVAGAADAAAGSISHDQRDRPLGWLAGSELIRDREIQLHVDWLPWRGAPPLAPAWRRRRSAGGRGVSPAARRRWPRLTAPEHIPLLLLSTCLSSFPRLSAGPLAQSRSPLGRAIGAIAMSVVMIGACTIGVSSIGLIWLNGSTSSADTGRAHRRQRWQRARRARSCCVGLPVRRRAAACIGGRVTVGAVRSSTRGSTTG